MRLLLFILFSLSFFLNAQTMDWRMAQQIGDNIGNEEVEDMALDSEGNIYVVGSFYGTITWSNQSMTAQSNQDGFLIKLDCMGKLVWMQQLSGAGWDEIRCVTVDKDDNVIVAGRFGLGQASIGGYTMSSLGNYDVFVAKCDGQGNFLWVKEYGSSAMDAPGGVTTDEEGDIYLTGSYSNLFGFGGQLWPSNGLLDIFVCKISSSGNDLWFYSAGGTDRDGGGSIKVHGTSVYVCGDFQDIVDFGMGPISSNGDWDVFLLSMDTSNMNINWVNTVGSNNEDLGYDLEINSQGELLMCGIMGGPLSFGNGVNLSPQPGWTNSYIVKIDQNGSIIWGHALSCDEEVYAYECEIDNYDNVYVTGTTFGQTSVNNLTMDISGGTTFWYNNTFLFMLDDGGNGQWEINVPGDGVNNHGIGIVVNASNEIFLGGRVEGINTFGSLPPISGDLNNTQSAYVALYGRPDLELSYNGQLDSLQTCTPIRLTANDGALNYVWYQDGLEVQQGLVDSLMNAASGSYIVEDQACPIDRDTFVLETMMDVQLNLDTPYIFCEGDAIPIQLSGADVYSWSPSTFLSCDNCADPIVSPIVDITYELAMEKGLCKDTLNISFVEDQNCITGNIYIPTAFSPNGDGVNDEFKVRYTGQYEGQMEVYDRWGKLVYQNELGQAWDGQYNSLLCPQGVYIYYLTYTTNQDITKSYSSNITLIR